MFNSLELTGRCSTHVREVPELGCILHAEAVPQVLAMRAAARAVGIELAIVSSFRDFDRQMALWNAKYSGARQLLDRDGRELTHALLSESALIDAILIWSALPGASRHHWGTDLDVIDRAAVAPDYRPQLVPAEFGSNGPFARLDAWLAANMAKFGFFRPYSTDRGGVQPVSYTHLDVYKRQAHDCSTASRSSHASAARAACLPRFPSRRWHSNRSRQDCAA